MASIGIKIRAVRQEKGISQEELAQTIGVTKSTISKYERGARELRLDQLQRIATALGVSVNDLIGIAPFLPENAIPPKGPTMAEIEQEAAALGMTVAEYLLSRPETRAAGEQYRATVERARQIYKARIDTALDKLNVQGQEKAVERVEELTEIPKYQRKAPPEGKDTALEEKPSEDP